MARNRMQLIHADISYIDQLMDVENASFTVPWSRNSLAEDLTRNMLAEYIAAVTDGRVIGYAGMWKIIDEAHITNLAVLPEYRRMGVGRMLLRRLISIARKNKFRLLTLEVRVSNYAAQKLYKESGFAADGLRRNYYADNNEDALIMTMYL